MFKQRESRSEATSRVRLPALTRAARNGLVQRRALPRLLGVAASMLAVAISIAFLSGLTSVEADNESIPEGTPVECADSSTFDGRSETNVASAPGGSIVTRICIEADAHPDAYFGLGGAGDCANVDDSARDGDGSLHSPCIASSGPIGCFNVADIGTQTVTVTSNDVDCTVAHLDFETQAIGGAPVLDKSHNAIWDDVDIGDRVEWILIVTNTNGQVIDIDDTLPPAFVLDTAFSGNDGDITCTTNLDTETVECDGTASVDSLEIRIRGVAVSCEFDSANAASGTVGGAAVSDTDTAINIQNCPAPAPSVFLQVHEDSCADNSPPPFPWPTTDTIVEGQEYCLGISTTDYVIDDTWTLSSVSIGGEVFGPVLCSTNSVVDNCDEPTPGPSPYVINLIPPHDSNSGIGGDVDFTFGTCLADTVTITLTYDGPTFATASDTATLNCISAEEPVGPSLVKSHDAASDELLQGEALVWTLTLADVNGLLVDIEDALPDGFELASVSSDDAGVVCSADTATDTAGCTGTATQDTVIITLNAAAPEDGCGLFTNTAAGTAGANSVSDSDSVTVIDCDDEGPDEEDPDDGTPGDGVTIIRPVNVDLEINNTNTNVLGVDNENTNQNSNDNDNKNDNENTNTNTQDQTNQQDQHNSNEQNNDISSGPEVNIDISD